MPLILCRTCRSSTGARTGLETVLLLAGRVCAQSERGQSERGQSECGQVEVRPAFGWSEEVLQVLPGPRCVLGVLVSAAEQADVLRDIGQVVPQPEEREGGLMDGDSTFRASGSP
jgi:hypothetical protein